MTTVPEDLATRILDGSPDAILICDRLGIVRPALVAGEPSEKGRESMRTPTAS